MDENSLFVDAARYPSKKAFTALAIDTKGEMRSAWPTTARHPEAAKEVVIERAILSMGPNGIISDSKPALDYTGSAPQPHLHPNADTLAVQLCAATKASLCSYNGCQRRSAFFDVVLPVIVQKSDDLMVGAFFPDAGGAFTTAAIKRSKRSLRQ
ncbi:hypothetical protein HPB50_006281 [Hyalomma asiaticum]|uniref:Uncharacterized protein n=1 Tax=Hyalomma asiaticum TaxID=266040 RepID=A0ACB7TDB2_HYAAI|nr:hypothetical protein HPB50_006281 [Hyalomma asiaticum]